MQKIFENKLIYAGVAFIFTAIIYAVTAAPGVTFTDAGELAGVAISLGVAHPTGYPLFVILGHLWSLLPISSSPIFEMNLFSVFSVAAANFFFFLLFQKIILNYLQSSKVSNLLTSNVISLAITLIFAFSQVIWEQATAIEVYSLHLLMLSLVLNAIFNALIYPDKRKKYLLLTALLLGLSFGNHMTTVLVIPAILFIYFDFEKPYFSKDKLLFLIILAIPLFLGLSLYIYPPLVSQSDPLFNWGAVSRGWDKFLYHVQGKQYQVWMFSDSEAWGENFDKFIATLPNQTAIIGIVFALAGLYYSFKHSRKIFWFALITIITCLSYSLNYSIHDIESYFIAAYIGIAIFMAIGVAGILQNFPKYSYILLAIPLIQLSFTYDQNDRSSEKYVDSYYAEMMNHIEKDAIIISSEWDFFCSAFWYKQAIEQKRTDVDMIELEINRRTWYPLMIKRWYPETYNKCSADFDNFLPVLNDFEDGKYYNPNELQRLFVNIFRCIIESNIDKRPIYITHEIMSKEPQIVAGFTPVPEGLAIRLYRNPQDAVFKTSEIDISGIINSATERQNHLTRSMLELLAYKLNTLAQYSVQQNMIPVAEKYNNQIKEINNLLN